MIESEYKPISQERKILIFEDTNSLTNYLLDQWVTIAKESIKRNNRFTVALSGGRSPMEFYCKLSALEDFGIWQRTQALLSGMELECNNSRFRLPQWWHP